MHGWVGISGSDGARWRYNHIMQSFNPTRMPLTHISALTDLISSGTQQALWPIIPLCPGGDAAAGDLHRTNGLLQEHIKVPRLRTEKSSADKLLCQEVSEGLMTGCRCSPLPQGTHGQMSVCGCAGAGMQQPPPRKAYLHPPIPATTGSHNHQGPPAGPTARGLAMSMRHAMRRPGGEPAEVQE